MKKLLVSAVLGVSAESGRFLPHWGSGIGMVFALSFASGDFWCISIGGISVLKLEILSSSHK
jgi:hypothetical protein